MCVSLCACVKTIENEPGTSKFCSKLRKDKPYVIYVSNVKSYHHVAANANAVAAIQLEFDLFKLSHYIQTMFFLCLCFFIEMHLVSHCESQLRWG